MTSVSESSIAGDFDVIAMRTTEWMLTKFVEAFWKNQMNKWRA